MSALRWWLGALVAPLLGSGLLTVAAQELRDPTQPPRIGPAALPSVTSGSEGLTVMVREGKPHLVVGTRWYAVGDSVGAMRIERITETEVWLHDGNALVKTPRFSGITRTPAGCDPQPEGTGVASATAESGIGGTIQKKTHALADAPNNTPAAAKPASNSVKCTP